MFSVVRLAVQLRYRLSYPASHVSNIYLLYNENVAIAIRLLTMICHSGDETRRHPVGNTRFCVLSVTHVFIQLFV